ncbi:hypothetical protein [Actinophytocola algeriensis]|uniref:Guanylate cyclase domain-containing protein n=1 Tax=Actinophytocola algeriensis TaxID=1768010 RepID=A0A7W7QCN8_9PSEU|nr:hypothetical protein [Actinophytocola algeriensis]MBB4911003.1 hypothetical protein [Actinophytocola algeriensis]MBE1473996.1 hypothetical protein [Actinophytocola algeriensis]
MDNKISVGGDVGGNFVIGDGNTVGEVTRAQAPAPARDVAGFTPRLGFVVDIVGFGRRDGAAKDDLQQRLDALLDQVVADLGVEKNDVRGSDAGDSRVLFLPVGVDPTRMLPIMLSAVHERLGRDNRRYRDRMRLRMAVGTGLVGTGPLGFTGELVIDLHRLVDSVVLREAVAGNPYTDLALLVGNAVHDDVIRPGYLDPGDFTRVEVTAKEFSAPAWLRLF